LLILTVEDDFVINPLKLLIYDTVENALTLSQLLSCLIKHVLERIATFDQSKGALLYFSKNMAWGGGSFFEC